MNETFTVIARRWVNVFIIVLRRVAAGRDGRAIESRKKIFERPGNSCKSREIKEGRRRELITTVMAWR